jgi:tetratricopeptide (TPR) repeat protein
MVPVAGTADFEKTIARLEQQDPQAPQALNARLEYADLLTDTTTASSSGDCKARLDAAQAQLDVLATRPALTVLLPLGPARLANDAYKIHAARAECDAPGRAGELQRALEAARHAASLYRAALDYQSAAVMQFNVAVTLHDLGDQDAAIVALQSALAMDRDFGFKDDAQDNTKLLLHWQGKDESDAAVAGLMKDFPARSVELKFNWSESDADVAIDASESNVIDGKIVQSHGAVVLKRQVRADLRSWTVSYTPGTVTADLGQWQGKNADVLRRFTAYLLTSALLRAPRIEVYHTGDFEYVHDPLEFGEALSAQVSARLGEPAPSQSEATGASRPIAQNLESVFLPQYVQSDAMETYNVETATWAGAKLEQGVWYQMTAPLFLPGMGMGQFLVTHNIEFSYTRQVPCTAADTGRTCVEIVLHATPDAKDLDEARAQVARRLKLASVDALHHWSTINIRLVVKPDTLVPYLSDTRRYWYVALDAALKNDPVISSERVVAATTYH